MFVLQQLKNTSYEGFLDIIQYIYSRGIGSIEGTLSIYHTSELREIPRLDKLYLAKFTAETAETFSFCNFKEGMLS